MSNGGAEEGYDPRTDPDSEHYDPDYDPDEDPWNDPDYDPFEEDYDPDTGEKREDGDEPPPDEPPPERPPCEPYDCVVVETEEPNVCVEVCNCKCGITHTETVPCPDGSK